MKNLQTILNNVEGYLISIQRNAEDGMYELEVGIPKNWVYKATKTIDYETILESDAGAIIKIFAKDNSLVIDDLIDFVDVIIETNQRIARMQEEFDEKMKKTKEELVSERLLFDEKLDEVRETSFKSIEEQLKENKRRKTVDPIEENTLEVELVDKLSN